MAVWEHYNQRKKKWISLSNLWHKYKYYSMMTQADPPCATVSENTGGNAEVVAWNAFVWLYLVGAKRACLCVRK